MQPAVPPFYAVVFGAEHEDIAYFNDIAAAVLRLLKQHQAYVANHESFQPFVQKYVWDGHQVQMGASGRQLSVTDIEQLFLNT